MIEKQVNEIINYAAGLQILRSGQHRTKAKFKKEPI